MPLVLIQIILRINWNRSATLRFIPKDNETEIDILALLRSVLPYNGEEMSGFITEHMLKTNTNQKDSGCWVAGSPPQWEAGNFDLS